MSQVIDILDHDIITKVATDQRTVVKTYWLANIMIFQVNRFEFPYAYQSKELTVFNQFRVESI
jgi:hypothetical protein